MHKELLARAVSGQIGKAALQLSNSSLNLTNLLDQETHRAMQQDGKW